MAYIIKISGIGYSKYIYCLTICISLFSRHKKKQFLYQIVTSKTGSIILSVKKTVSISRSTGQLIDIQNATSTEGFVMYLMRYERRRIEVLINAIMNCWNRIKQLLNISTTINRPSKQNVSRMCNRLAADLIRCQQADINCVSILLPFYRQNLFT